MSVELHVPSRQCGLRNLGMVYMCTGNSADNYKSVGTTTVYSCQVFVASQRYVCATPLPVIAHVHYLVTLDAQ